MANSYKDIIITTNIGSTSDDPKIEFRGGDTSTNTNISLKTYPTSNGTLSFEGSAGQLFSITNDLSGTIFSVNDISGIPSIEVLDTGTVKIAQYSGNVGIGTSTPTYKLDVAGTANTGALTVSSLNITGAAANQIFYEAPSGITGFIAAPTQNNTFLNYTTAAGFTWQLASGASVGTANVSTYQTVTNATTGTWYPALYNGTSGDRQVNANNALSFNAATGALNIRGSLGISEVGGSGSRLLISSSGSGAVINQNDNSNIVLQTSGVTRLTIAHSSGDLTSTGNITASSGTITASSFSGAGTGLTGTAASLTAGNATLAADVAGGSANQVLYQTGAGSTSYITAPSTNNTFLNYTTGGGFTWQPVITSAGGTFTGSVTINGDLNVSGNTTFTGNTSYINVTNLEVNDPIIYLGANNYTSDLVSIGFVGNYFNGANNLHTGLFRQHASNNYYLFTGVRDELDNVNVISTSANGFMYATLYANINSPSIVATTFSGSTITGSTITLDSLYLLDTNSFTTSSTAQVSVDSFASATYRSAKYQAQIRSGTSYHVIELLLVHDGTTVYLSQYGEIFTGVSLGTFDATITSGTLNLLFTPTNAITTIKVAKNLITV